MWDAVTSIKNPFFRIGPLPVAIEYHKSVKRLKSEMQSHRLKTPFSEKKAQILQSLTQICRN